MRVFALRSAIIVVLLSIFAACAKQISGGRSASDNSTGGPGFNIPASGAQPTTQSPSGNTGDGTADGSGGGTRKSTFAQVDEVLLSPKNELLNFKKRLRLAFHRLDYFRRIPKDDEAEMLRILTTSDSEPRKVNDPNPIWNLIDRVIQGTKNIPVHDDIEQLELKIQDEVCLASDGRETAMAIKNHVVCASRNLLSLVAPEDLLVQVVALGVHEVSHLRGITSEDEAEAIQEFVSEHSKFLVQGKGLADISEIIELQRWLTPLLGETSIRNADDKILQREERCLGIVKATEFLGNLMGTIVSQDIRPDLEDLLIQDCTGIDQSVWPRQFVMKSYQGREQVVKIGSRVASMISKLDQRRRQIAAILSPFYTWYSSGYTQYVSDPGEGILLFNAIAPLIHEDGTWASKLSDEEGLKLRQRVRCTADGFVLLFSAKQCPKQAKNGAWESYRYGLRDERVTGKICASIRPKDQNGVEHEVLMVLGPHTVDSLSRPTMIRDTNLNELVNIEIFFNGSRPRDQNQDRDWRKSFQNGIFIPEITAEKMMTSENNISVTVDSVTFSQYFENPGTSLTATAIMNPETAKHIEFQLGLPISYNRDMEKIIYDKRKIQLKCDFEPDSTKLQ